MRNKLITFIRKICSIPERNYLSVTCKLYPYENQEGNIIIPRALPVLFLNCKIWMLQNSIYWYIIEHQGRLYSFDIRLLAAITGTQEYLERLLLFQNRRKWLQLFFRQQKKQRLKFEYSTN